MTALEACYTERFLPKRVTTLEPKAVPTDESAVLSVGLLVKNGFHERCAGGYEGGGRFCSATGQDLMRGAH